MKKKIYDKPSRKDDSSKDLTGLIRGGRGRHSASDVVLLWKVKDQHPPRGDDPKCGPEDPAPQSQSWQRYQRRLAHLIEQSQKVNDNASAQHLVEEAVSLAATAVAGAAAADRARTEYLANMSHEMRTPLNAIIGFAEFMTLDTATSVKVSGKALEYAQHIKDAGQHLLFLVNDRLDLAKAEADKTELNEVLSDFPELVQSCMALVRERAEEFRIRLEASIPEPCHRLFLDQRKIKQVLVNLLSNAVKFTPKGGQVLLSARPVGEVGIEIAVADTGVGMTNDELDHVLEPFTQFRRDINSDQPGTGLGLPLARALIELHRGSLTIESEYGTGTTIRVLLPHARDQRRERANSSTEVQQSSEQA